MRKRLWMVVFPVVLVIIGVGGWWLARPPAVPPVNGPASSAGTAAAATVAAPVELPGTLAADLASQDAGVRGRAQKMLAEAGFEQVGRLKELAGACADAGIAGTLRKRAEELEEQATADPPPISLSIREASAEGLGSALSKAIGQPFEFFPAPANADGLFTLEVQRQPFWSVLNELNHQHAFTVDSGLLSNRQRGLVMRLDQPMPELHPYHGFVVIAKAFGPPNILGAPPPPADQLTLNYAIAADPRIWVTNLTPGSHDIAVDGTPMPVVNYYRGLVQMQVHANLWTTAITVRMSDPFAGKTVLIRAQHHFTVVSKREVAVIEDMAKHVNETFKVGLDELTLSSNSSFSASRLSYVLTTLDQETRADIDVFDAAGTLVQHNNYFKNNGATITGNFTPPFKLQITAPAKTVDVVVPVELRIALP